MFLEELFENEIENKGQIQGELLSAMSDDNQFVQINWEDMIETEGYVLMSNPQVDPSFKAKLNQIFKKFLGVEMEETMTASTAINERDNIFKVINYLQKNSDDKYGIDPKRFALEIPNYKVDKGSIFNWHGIKFLVIKDRVGQAPEKGVVRPKQEIHYTIYAAKNREPTGDNVVKFPGLRSNKSEVEKYDNALAKQELDRHDESLVAEKSKNKAQSRLMTATCKNPKFRKKTKIPKKVACDFHEKDRGHFHK